MFGFNRHGIIHVATQPILGDQSLHIQVESRASSWGTPRIQGFFIRHGKVPEEFLIARPGAVSSRGVNS